MTNSERYAIILNVLANVAEPEGMMNPHDDDERERLAVAFIRKIKEEAGMMSERDRCVQLIAEGILLNMPTSYRVGIASQILDATHASNKRNFARGILFFGRVGRLKWFKCIG